MRCKQPPPSTYPGGTLGMRYSLITGMALPPIYLERLTNPRNCHKFDDCDDVNTKKYWKTGRFSEIHRKSAALYAFSVTECDSARVSGITSHGNSAKKLATQSGFQINMW